MRQATDGRGVDLVVETFGADTTEQSMRAVGLHGQMNRRRPFMDQTQLNDFIGRYIGMWHESDAVRRCEIVLGLWAEDAENITRNFVVRGLAEIILRVDRAYQEWVATRGPRSTDCGWSLIWL